MKLFRWLVGGAALVFLAMQLVPYGRAHSNPPVQAEPAWDSPQTKELFTRACADCHSNETVWPWYSNIAPVSWLVQKDVDEGRAKLNVSQWGTGEQEADDVQEVIREGSMPPKVYLPTHPEARLSAAEADALISGLMKSFAVGSETINKGTQPNGTLEGGGGSSQDFGEDSGGEDRNKDDDYDD